MQWNVEDLHNWEEVREYVDTALLPHYKCTSDLTLPEHAFRMTYLMSLACAVEQRLKGRILLFPIAYHMTEAKEESEVGLAPQFAYHFVLRFSGQTFSFPQESTRLSSYLTVGDEDLESKVRFDITVDVLYQEILHRWAAKR